MGDTPIVKLQKTVPKDAANVYLKLEEFNPGGSIKARIAFRMIIDAEKKNTQAKFGANYNRANRG
jgi:cysteine synthase A